jgi:hypothetical protein
MAFSAVSARARGAALLGCGVVAIAATLGLALGPTAAASQPREHHPSVAAAPAASSLPVVVNCTEHRQTRPGSYILACGDGNAYVTGLHWASWGQAAAFATGTDTFRACIPSCAAGHLHSFPILATLWRARPLPGHQGVRYFSRLTIIYTGSRSYRAGGKTYRLPQTATYPLSALGGAGN